MGAKFGKALNSEIGALSCLESEFGGGRIRTGCLRKHAFRQRCRKSLPGSQHPNILAQIDYSMSESSEPLAPSEPSRMEHRFQQIVVEEAPGFRNRMIRALLRALSLPYAAVIEGYKLLFKLGILRTIRLPCRIVSVGNLALGGVGKTVAVQAIARALQKAGLSCVVLSYGFRSTSPGPYSVVSDGSRRLLNPEEAGDEAVMLADSLPGVPVVIGKRRALSGAAAVELFHPDVILLDDGFQHWRLHRDVDIVLLDARKPLGNGRVFPAGILREGPRSLRRASLLVLTRCDQASLKALENARHTLRRIAPRAPLFETTHRLAAARVVETNAGTPSTQPAEVHRQSPPCPQGPLLLVSGIVQNEAFETAVRETGASVRSVLRFPDHHLYSTSDVKEIAAAGEGCSAVLTTEKDAVKLAGQWSCELPLLAAPVALEGISDDQWLEILM